MTLGLAKRYVDQLLASDEGRARYRLMPLPGEQVEIIPGLIYRYTLESGGRLYTLSLFLRLGGLGGALWQQEIRTLERLSGFQHPALPELVDGGHLDGVDGDVGAAYVRTVRKGTPADAEWFGRLARAERSKILPHLWLLADALGVLHGASVSHRGLWPGALFVEQKAGDHPDDDAPPEIESVHLARFEMSALLANLFRSRTGVATYDQLRQTYLADGDRSLLYAPPERLNFVFDRPNGDLGGPAGDVFSLGMIAAEWLVTGAPDGPVPASYDGIRAIQEQTRHAVRTASGNVPGHLREVIDSMLDPTPSGRPTAFEVQETLAAGYADTQMMLADDVPEVPYLVLFMPRPSDILLRDQWHLIHDSATTQEGADQLTELLETDMRGAEVLHSPAGAEGFANDEPAKLRRAQTVVIGTQVTWFCDNFWIRRPGGGIRTFDELLIVKYVRRTGDIEAALGRLRVNALVRRVPMVEAQAAPTEYVLAEAISAGRPPWSAIVDKAESSRTQSPKEREYLDSLEWYLKYQRAKLDSRTYAYTVDPTNDGDRIHLRWDPIADRTRNTGEDILSQIAIQDGTRADMAVFVSNENDGLDRGRVHLASDPTEWRNARQYDVVEVIEPNIVVVSARGAHRPPEQGWLRMSTDAGTPPQIARQREALIELGLNRVLLNRLIEPKGEVRGAHQWGDAGEALDGEGREAVRQILMHEGIFALQGPPGTGKTEVTSEAVVEYLTQEPGARVLVSAQSHDALENLAVRITRKLGITVPEGSNNAPTLDRLALRIRTPGSTSYESMQELSKLQPAELADEVIAYSARRAKQWLSSRRFELPAMVPVVQRWLDRAPHVHLELTRRVCTAANVVFATTGAATRRNLFVEATNEPFDWVVVEEAARAWPTELALPLVRGVRWTLVGDHAQIGAYARNEVERFLDELGHHDIEELKAMWEARDRHSRNFGTFAKLFDAERAGSTMVLSQQYRMNAEISDVVGEVFYSASGGLRAMRQPAPHPLDAPQKLLDRRLIWLDTGVAERAVGFWSNEHEAAICAELVRSMRPEPGRPGGPSLAVLTPYRDQVQLLQGRLSEHFNRIHTVDGFQGREADIVVVSLVRDRRREGGTPVSTVGHVADSARVNVMLSRARELLVLVGRFEIYATSAGKDWREVTDHIQQSGGVIAAGSRWP